MNSIIIYFLLISGHTILIVSKLYHYYRPCNKIKLIIFYICIQNGSVFIQIIEDEIGYYSSKGLSNFTGSDEHNFKLCDGDAILGRTSHSVVCKGLIIILQCSMSIIYILRYVLGVYNDDFDVAVKIIWSEMSFNKEIEILKALNAINNPKIEEHGIPRIHYHGKFFHTFFAIAMTLFNETLMDVHDRYNAQGKHLSELSILLMFKEAVSK